MCSRQLAYIDQLNSNFSSAGLKVLTVNVNKPNILNLVRPYINKRKYKFDVAVDPGGKLAKQFGVLGFPTLFIVDKDGNIIHKKSGYEDGNEDGYLQELIEYFKSENIAYKEFEYEKQANENIETLVKVDF